MMVYDDNVDNSCSSSLLLELLDGSHHLAVQPLRVNLHRNHCFNYCICLILRNTKYMKYSSSELDIHLSRVEIV